MKGFFLAIVVFFASMTNSARSQETDLSTCEVDRLHFHILKGRGEGIPILFEAGGGDDAAIWTNITKPVRDTTSATRVTHDRAGFGRSQLNAKEQIEPLSTAYVLLLAVLGPILVRAGKQQVRISLPHSVPLAW
jgi:hypothetical protein